MDIGFIGLGNMGFPMARRLIEAGHKLVVFDTRKEVTDKLVARGRVLRAGRTLSVAAADVFVVSDGREEALVATALVSIRNIEPSIPSQRRTQ